ncbi:MAG: helix-turn-helix transcriptional regulator [Methylophilus sp.]|jgi:transcriptional regulator with XRE-family HTH domain|nr:helix-turn-helix transcriptional regulator [Methylophilus sp.]
MEESGRKLFAERLRDARERLRGLKQTQLAEKAGLPVTSISHFENPEGTRKPSFDNLRRLANALDVTTDYLLGLSDDHVGMTVDNALYRDVQNLTDQDKEFAQAMIQKMLEKNPPKE